MNTVFVCFSVFIKRHESVRCDQSLTLLPTTLLFLTPLYHCSLSQLDPFIWNASIFHFSSCWLSLFKFFCFCLLNLHFSHSFFPLFYSHNKPLLLYFLLLLFTSHTGFLLPCQSLCEFYANHCARIEALRRQLEEEEKGRQVEHTAAAGMGWYCSWVILGDTNQVIKNCW